MVVIFVTDIDIFIRFYFILYLKFIINIFTFITHLSVKTINKLKASNTETHSLNTEDKIIEAMNHVRNKNKQHVTKERIFNHITKTKTSIDQGQLMETFESMKDNSFIFNKPKGKPESYFVTNKKNNSWIIKNKSPAKVETVTSPKFTSPSTLDEI